MENVRRDEVKHIMKLKHCSFSLMVSGCRLRGEEQPELGLVAIISVSSRR